MLNPKDLVDVADQLGLIQAVKAKLVSQPDPASDKLAAVLEEISKIYLAFEDELVRYLSLTFEPEDLAEERKVLLDLESGKINARIAAARGHCSKISTIYVRYLSPWFRRVLDDSETKMMQQLFDALSSSDNFMLESSSQLSAWLVGEATATLDLVEQGDILSAQNRVSAARRQVQQIRRDIANALQKIRLIEAEFIALSGAL